MRCKDVRSRLQNYVLGEISEGEKLPIENHLNSCQECQKEEQIRRWLIVTLESDVMEEPSANFVQSVMERLPERIPAVSIKFLFASILSLTLGGLFGLGFLFREKLLQLTYDLQISVAKALSSLDPEAFLANFLMPKMGSIYLVTLGFACLLVTVSIIWFARYYWEPVQYRIEPK